MTITAITTHPSITPCPSPAKRSASDGTTVSSCFDSAERTSPDLTPPRPLSCCDALPALAGAGFRRSDSRSLSDLLRSCSLSEPSDLSRLRALSQAQESLLTAVKCLADKFFLGAGLVKIGESLEVSPTDKDDIWRLFNRHTKTFCHIPSSAAALEELQSQFILRPAEYSPAFPENMEDIKSEVEFQIRNQSCGYKLIDHEANMQLYAEPGDVIYVFCEKKVVGPVTLKFASGLVFFAEGLEKGYTIFDASQRKEPYHKDSCTELQAVSDAFITSIFKELHGKPHSIPVMFSGVVAVKKELVFDETEHEWLYRFKIKNQQTGEEALIKPGFVVVDADTTPKYLSIVPIKYTMCTAIPAAEREALDIKLEDFQKKGERTYRYEPMSGVTVYSFPDNTMTICSTVGMGGINLKLTFADGTVFFTENVVQGISHYRIGTDNAICDISAITPFIDENLYITSNSSITLPEEKAAAQIAALKAKVMSFQKAGRVVVIEEPRPGTRVYSFPDNTISIYSREGYHTVENGYRDIELTFASGDVRFTRLISQGVSDYFLDLKPLKIVAGSLGSSKGLKGLHTLNEDMHRFKEKGGKIESYTPYEGLVIHYCSNNAIVVCSHYDFKSDLKLKFTNGHIYRTDNIPAGISYYKVSPFL